MKLLEGKKGLIMGVANDKSISWGIAAACHAHGAQLAFSYQGEILKKRIDPLAGSIGSTIVEECDVSNEQSVKDLFTKIEKQWGKLDFIVHGIAFANKDALKGKYFDVTMDDFLQAMNISVYSFTSVVKNSHHIMNEGGSYLTLTYYGAEKVIPNYNVMGVAKAGLEASVRYLASDLGENNIRVNSISAGPIRTLAASGISGFKSMLDVVANAAPLKRNVTLEDIAGTGVYLLSDLASGVTGENIHVDCGFSNIGLTSNETEKSN